MATMTTDDKILEIAGAIRLLAWHVDRLSRDKECSAELQEIKDAMEKVQEATLAVRKTGGGKEGE